MLQDILSLQEQLLQEKTIHFLSLALLHQLEQYMQLPEEDSFSATDYIRKD